MGKLKFSILLLICAISFKITNAQDPPEYIDESNSPYIFQSKKMPADEGHPRYTASVGNGHLATTVYTETVYLNGVYNGNKGNSHRARVPSRNNIRIINTDKYDNNDVTFSLNTQDGYFIEKFTIKSYEVYQRTFAHRYYSQAIVTQISITPLNPTVPLTLNLSSTHEKEDSVEDFYWTDENSASIPISFNFVEGITLEKEDSVFQRDLSQVVVLFSNVDSSISINPTSNPIERTYLGFYHVKHPQVFIDEEGNNEYEQDQSLTPAIKGFIEIFNLGYNEIFESHKNAWNKVWESGRIEVVGTEQDQSLYLGKIINGCWYYLLSSLPVTEGISPASPNEKFYGLSPGGLAYGTLLNDYQGHSFWDTEIWMYPTMLYFFPQKAQALLNYRLNSLQAARELAIKSGYSGARFPWESSFTGREATPDCCPETKYQQLHISGDISFAIRQYIAMTRDEDWLFLEKSDYITHGCGLIREIAQFWASKAYKNESTGHYDIKSVMPPDEDHHDVDNSIYTNVMAAYSIYFAEYAKCLCTVRMSDIPDEWIHIANHLKLLYDPVKDFHPEFEGYKEGSEIKQADVVLLGFPLMYPMEKSTRENDLLIYEKVTREDGPAMTWAMHTIGFLELEDNEKVDHMFNKSYQNYVREPFKIWTEAQWPNLGAINFITGMGGFLQSIVSGFGGLRVRLERLEFLKPRALPRTNGLNLRGIKYLGNAFDVEITNNAITLKLTSKNDNFTLEVEFNNGTKTSFDGTIVLPADEDQFSIYSSVPTNCEVPSDITGKKFIPNTSPKYYLSNILMISTVLIAILSFN